MSRIFIGIGSNQGDRLLCISEAVKRLNAGRDVRVTKLATILETDPVGGPPQPPYLNTVAEAETSRTPQEVLGILQVLERDLGRVPSPVQWAPRPIDLDLLLYDDRIIEGPGLTVPHPRLHERAFVLEPLAQLAPEVLHPVLKRTIESLAQAHRRSAVASAPGGQ
jgi:2-amino-4-hydroxy-6-hydroxymethyldihydropteridine diphosphokinase